MTPRERNLADIGLIALRHGLTRHDVLGRSRKPIAVAVRRECAEHFVAKGKGWSEIGRIMQRDHSSVRYLVHGRPGRGVHG